MLKRQFDLIVLKTELIGAPASEPNVRFTLQCKVEGTLQDIATWMAHTEALGLGERLDAQGRLGQGPPVELPGDLLQGLSDFMTQETNRDRPLWVHLVRPYGVLRFVPWERLLGEALGLPILMLPDFIFPRPRETASVLEVVLCGSAPLGCEEASVHHRVRQAVDRILEASVRRTRIHVFVDQEFAGSLHDGWKASGHLGSTVFLHDQAIAAKYVAEDLPSRLLDRTGSLRSPWLLWMREALRGRSVDVVHFVCHGHLSRERGALLFAQSPLERTERYLAGPVGSAELQTFLTQVGAWSTVFTSLPDNFSEPGLRALADEIAQSRPGPLMMNVLREDSDAAALPEAYRFLYAFDPVPAPLSKALFIYCQPYRTTDAVRTRRGRGASNFREFGGDSARNLQQLVAAEQADDVSPLDTLFDQDENVSPLVAATERFAEQVHLRYQQLARDEILPEARGERDRKVAEETLEKLRQAVAEMVGEAGPASAGDEGVANDKWLLEIKMPASPPEIPPEEKIADKESSSEAGA
jgi:hypothetical protein